MKTLLSWLSIALFALAIGAPQIISAATPVKKGKPAVTGIEWQVDPGQVVIYLNGKKLGDAAKLKGKVTKTRPGKHSVKLMNGQDETEMDIQVKKGQTLTFTFTFEAG